MDITVSHALLPLAASVPTGHELIQAIVTGTLLGGLFAVTALGLSLIFGVMRLINLVHGELVVLGAYLAYALTKDSSIDPLLSLVVIAPAMFVVALPLQRYLLTPIIDKGPEPALLTTFGLSIIVQQLFVLIFSADTHSLDASYANSSVGILGLDIPAIYLISFAFALVLVGAVHLLLQRTGMGRGIRASAEDPVAAGVIGVNVARTYALVYGLAAACAAIGGVLAGLAFSFTPTTGVTYLLTGFAVVVLGGLGSVKGTLIGGLLIGMTESVGAAFLGDGYRDFVAFVAFLIILAIRPQGLFGRAS
jgi:branched-chain amino acid transport system permease protein